MRETLYIRSMNLLSAQDTFHTDSLPDEIHLPSGNRINAIDPPYMEFLSPVMARRMGRIIKMGMASAMQCLKDGQVEQPDAIISGTALGCLGDTEKFLLALIKDDEQFLTPTWFIQSIQNTVAAQIALHLGCRQHNFTFTHKAFSLESGLIDAIMLIKEGEATQVLVGVVDEITDNNFYLYKKLGHWKENEVASANELYDQNTHGSIGGEAALYLVVTQEKSDKNIAAIKGIQTIYKPDSTHTIIEKCRDFLNYHNCTPEEIDAVILGFSGDNRTDNYYDQLYQNLFADTPQLRFKHLSGEFQTATSFAVWLGASILKSQTVPDAVKWIGRPANLNRILIYNGYDDNHVLYLLESIHT